MDNDEVRAKNTEIEIISSIGRAALLEQLAEECAELAQAALKLARLERGENPTPKSEDECMDNLLEEAGDVNICMSVLSYAGVLNFALTHESERKKQERWAKRIKEENENGTN